MALCLRSAMKVPDPLQQLGQRPLRERRMPRLYEYGQHHALHHTGKTVAAVGIPRATHRSAIAAPAPQPRRRREKPRRGASVRQRQQQQHAEPAAGRRCRDSPCNRSNNGITQLPDGGRALNVAVRITPKNTSLYMPKALAETCPSVPHNMMLVLRVDGEPAGYAPKKVELDTTNENCRGISRYSVRPFPSVVRTYLGYRITMVSVNGRRTEMTLHLHSPAARERADAIAACFPSSAGTAAGPRAAPRAAPAAAAAAARTMQVASTPSTPAAGKTPSSLAGSLEPFETVEQAIEQLVFLLDQLSAPDELMRQVQSALLELHNLGDQQSSRKRIGLLKAQYSIVRFWVGRGDADEALHAVRMLLAKATRH